MASGPADFIQRLVHGLEVGGVAVWIRRALILLVVIGLAVLYQFREFRGLSTAEAMDQAQIGRELAEGKGFRTNFIRPRAIGQLQANGKNVQANIWSDTYHAPLPVLVNAAALFPVKGYWKMSPRDVHYAGDEILSVVGILFFLGSIVLLYFIGRRLFDHRLALMACGIVLLTDLLWQYSVSGLPQMLMLFLFHVTVLLIISAVQAQETGGRVGAWLAAVGLSFGLLALTHSLTIWIFFAALLFFAFYFRPRVWAAAIVLVPFAIIYMPWLIRTFAITGTFGGVAIYTILDGVVYPEAGWMRRIGFDTSVVTPSTFAPKVINNFIKQTGELFRFFGWSVIAPVFFVALLHRFRRSDTSIVKWMMLAMWGGAVAGMAFYGLREEQGFAANQLHLLFLPVMICFGLAFLLVQWNRTEVQFRLARLGFITGLFLLSALPLILNFVMPKKPPIRWPPYVPPYISVLNDWMKPNEITAADVPWAVAWYADRPAIWLPENLRTVTELNDWGQLGAPINGLYLTPMSGSQNTLADILKGEYRDWANVILRNVDLSRFPFKWATLLGLENEAVFFSTEDRQKIPPPDQ